MWAMQIFFVLSWRHNWCLILLLLPFPDAIWQCTVLYLHPSLSAD